MEIPMNTILQEINFNDYSHLLLNDTVDIKVVTDNGKYKIYICEIPNMEVEVVSYMKFFGMEEND